MTWEVSVFLILGLVIVGGVVWYERSHPSSRMVALVAALSALAVAGRLVLAPIPNVVATTDIALITGYALGGAPGFAVGALAAPVSNFWLGQGPWTPWQMAGWGLVGLGGAALAALTGRRLGRVGLATACGLAGFAYGALLDLSVMVSYGGEQSLDRYLALSARGIPFNVAHALGNVALALAAGPALVRMISRYRTRLEFTWRPAGATWALLAAVVVASATAVVPTAKAGAGEGRAWLERAQRADGGYGASSEIRSSPQMTGWAMLGLEAAGRNPLDVPKGGTTPVDYLRGRAAHLQRRLGDLELAILGLEGAGIDSTSFAGHDLGAELARKQGGNGSFAGQVNLTAYGALALRAAGASGPAARAAAWIRRAQNGDGGWGAADAARSEPDSTGSAIQALDRGGNVDRGVRYLRRVQKGEGGWGLYEGGVTNSQSTAFAVMGLVAAGVDPGRVRRHGRSGLSYLSARQRPDGHYAYSSGTDQTPTWVTSQALLAVSSEALPIEAVQRSPGGAPQPEPDLAPTTTVAQAPTAAPSGGGSGEGAKATGASGGGKHDRAGGAAEHPERDRAKATNRPQRTTVVDLTADSAPGEDSGGSNTTTIVIAGFAALIAALAAGFLWYRRRLPH
jgi:energy-coupling factor transport system substrate-specific component